jgi:ABC-type microcin C transport system permease subunit YejB
VVQIAPGGPVEQAIHQAENFQGLIKVVAVKQSMSRLIDLIRELEV